MTPVEVGPGIWLVRDTCNVYLVKAEGADTAVAIDFGSGDVLDALADLGIRRITDVLMTHHHRDQGQGLPRAVEHGARIHVPPVERDLFDAVDELWRTRPLDNDYVVRQDRFSLLEPVPVHATVPEYRFFEAGGVRLRPIPTPGHTTGSVTYLLDRGGARHAFSGDLIYAPGKVWSLASTQWTYTDNEGPAMAVLSCLLLGDEKPDVLYPSHGDPMEDAGSALALTAERLQAYVDTRRPHPWDLTARLRSPFVPITEHLLLNRSSMSCSYVLLSRTGEALLVDYGYDMFTGLPSGTGRASRRPWLASLPALKADFGVSRISVALATHYHDDHIAGMPLLRDVEGAELWAPDTVAPILADPWRYDLPCQWYEPIVVDRAVPVGETVTWNEYEIGVHAQPGHTLFAAAFSVEVDGVRVVFTGDQQENMGVAGERHEILNYQYRNRMRLGDYVASAELYRRIAPGLLLSGHWQPREVDGGYLDYLLAAGRELDEIHAALLPLDELDLDADGVLCRLVPYRAAAEPGAFLRYSVELRNPHREPAEAVVRPVVPRGWTTEPAELRVPLDALGTAEAAFVVRVGTEVGPRRVLALDVEIGGLRLGQHCEAIVDVGGRDARP